jgi:hypothetical protein
MEYDYETSINIDSIKEKLESERKLFLNNNEIVINNINVY